MKIRMLEFYQGRGDPSLAYGEECDVPGRVSETLAAWLLEHRKAEVVEGAPEVYDGKPLADEQKLQRHDMNVYGEVQEADATPAAVKFAQENGIDLAQIKGTGSGGRVILPDVQSYLGAEEDAEEPQE